MLAEEDRLGWVGAGMGWYGLECIWSVLSVVYLCEVLIVWKESSWGLFGYCTNQTDSRVKGR